MTIEDYAEERNIIFFTAQSLGKEFEDRIWTELGVANRHINRVVNGVISLQFVEREIEKCLQRTKNIVDEKKAEGETKNEGS